VKTAVFILLNEIKAMTKERQGHTGAYNGEEVETEKLLHKKETAGQIYTQFICSCYPGKYSLYRYIQPLL
jgi:hypothetical protein